MEKQHLEGAIKQEFMYKPLAELLYLKNIKILVIKAFSVEIALFISIAIIIVVVFKAIVMINLKKKFTRKILLTLSIIL